MAVIGIISVVLFFFTIVSIAVTGRKTWFVLLFWCLPTYGMAQFAPEGTAINGLVVVISYFMVFITVYSLWGVKLWHIGERKSRKLLLIIIFVLNFLICAYYVYQCISLGYIGIKGLGESKAVRTVSAVIFGALIGGFMVPVSVTALDMFFSKKENFVLIHCSPLRGSKKQGIRLRGRYAIKGIQNGKEYVFRMTRKAFLLLKPQKNLVMEARRGVLGGVYVQGNLYKDEHRRNKRINRILVRHGIFVFILAVVVILFIIRIRLGLSFDEIFREFGKEVLGWKR